MHAERRIDVLAHDGVGSDSATSSMLTPPRVETIATGSPSARSIVTPT